MYKFLLATVMLVAVPTAASATPLIISTERFEEIAMVDAPQICPRAIQETHALASGDYAEAWALARGYTKPEVLVLLGLCISYGQGFTDGVHKLGDLLRQ